MADESQNSRNPANSGSMSGMLREVMSKFLQGVDGMLPAVVISYDRDENVAEVRPLVQVLKTDNTFVDRARIASVPVINIGGGNAVLTFNIEPGDLGWIKANDRDISLFMDSLSAAPPNTLRKHSFSDGLFIPDQFRKWTLAPEDSANAVFQTLDGTQRIALHDDKVKITSNALVEIISDVQISGSLVVGDGILTFGAGIFTDNITSFADFRTSTGLTLKTHVHPPGTLVTPAGPAAGTSGVGQ